MAGAQLIAGMTAAAAAAACFDGAVLLQAREARAVPAEHGLRISLLRRLVARPRWLVGLALAALGWPLQLAAFALAPLTVAQPLLALGMVLLLAAGGRVLGEVVRSREWIAAAAVIVGIVVLALTAPPHSDRMPGAAALALAAIALLAIIAVPYARRGATRATSLIASAGCAFALSAITGKLLTAELAGGRFAVALGLAAATAACSAVGLLSDTTAMQRFEATRVAPPMFVLEVAIPVALAPALFGERPASITAAAGVIGGLVLVLGGGATLGAARAVRAPGQPGDRAATSSSTSSAAAGSAA